MYGKYLSMGDFSSNENPELYISKHAFKPQYSTSLASSHQCLRIETARDVNTGGVCLV